MPYAYFETAGPRGFTRRFRIPIYHSTFPELAQMGYIKFSEAVQDLNPDCPIVTRPEINDAWRHVLEKTMNAEVADGDTLTEEQRRRLELAGDQLFGHNVDRYWAMKARRNPGLPREYFEVAAYQDLVVLSLLNESRSGTKDDEDMTEEQLLSLHSDFTDLFDRHAMIHGLV